MVPLEQSAPNKNPLHIIFFESIHVNTSSLIFFFPSCSRQGKEIIEFYLRELENEGVTHVPRWTCPSVCPALPAPNTLSISPPELQHTSAATVSASQVADTKEGASQDAKQDSGAPQAEGVVEILVGTPEGAFPQIKEFWTLSVVAFLI